MRPTAPRREPQGFAHPLQPLLDTMGRDPAMASERRRIEEYIAKSSVVLSDAEPEREDLAAIKLAIRRQEAQNELTTVHLVAHISDRDQEWLRQSVEFLKVLTALPSDARTEMQSRLLDALILGTYARLAPEALVNDLIVDADRR